MRHAIKTPRYVTVASWLAVTGLGLAIGAVGAGGLPAETAGPDERDEPVAGVPAPVALRAQDKGFVAFEPTSLRLPSGRLAPIQSAPVHPDGALDVPRDPSRVGWWTGGARAGDPYGSIVLAGHVDSADFGVGVLAEMRDMRPGQDLKVADGKRGQVYRVEKIRKLPKTELAAGTDLFDQAVRHRLVLITCGGPFDPRTHRYRDNLVIVAKPVRRPG